MTRRREVQALPVHLRGRSGVTHALRDWTSACGERSVPGCTVTTLDSIDCMTCLARGFETDTHVATIEYEP